MTINYNARVVNSGLVLNLDAANSRSLNTVNSNLLTSPEDFTISPWFTLGANVSRQSNSIVAPNGSLTADTFLTSTFVSGDSIYQDLPGIRGNTPYVLSVFVKAGTSTSISFAAFYTGNSTEGFSINFNPVTGLITGGTGTVVSYPDGWYRISFKAIGTISANNNLRWQVYLNNTGSVYLWGAQLEIGSSLSDYYSTITPQSTSWTDLSGLENHATLFPNTLSNIEYLIVAGGGSGGGTAGGGGGGGGVLTGFTTVRDNTTYTVTVGAGGASVNGNGTGISGGNSSLTGPVSIIALGGGGGGAGGNNSSGLPGGSGGGAVGTGSIGLGIATQGTSGGAGGSTYTGGGGGGATQQGSSANSSNYAGNGGQGVQSSITGIPTYYGGGGGGGTIFNTLSGTGGLGGGGKGGYSGGTVGTNGTDNTGGGGGAGGNNNPIDGSASGKGGSGIVVIRYPGIQKASGGAISYDGVYTTHTFTSTGNSSFITNTNAAPVYTTLNNGALVFNGSTNQVIVPNSSSLSPTNELTLNVWMYTTGATTSGLGLIAKAPEINDYDYMLYLTNSSTAISFYKKNSAGVAESTTGYSSTFIGNWVNVCYTVSGTSCIGYVNGVAVDTKTFTNAGIRSSSNPLRIGHAWGNVYYAGYLPLVQIYNRTLSAAEVTQNFLALKGRYGV